MEQADPVVAVRQSYISRLETGSRTAITYASLALWRDVCLYAAQERLAHPQRLSAAQLEELQVSIERIASTEYRDLLSKLHEDPSTAPVSRYEVSREDVAGREESLLGAERTAVTIQDVQPLLVPALLQPRVYAEVVLRGFGTPDQVARAVDVRVQRGQRLAGNPVQRYEVIVAEAAFEAAIEEGPADLAAQVIAHVAELASHRHVRVRVVPRKALWRRAPMGAFTVYHPADTAVPPMVAISTDSLLVRLTDAADVDAHVAAFNAAAEVAIGAVESLAWLHRRAA